MLYDLPAGDPDQGFLLRHVQAGPRRTDPDPANTNVFNLMFKKVLAKKKSIDKYVFLGH